MATHTGNIACDCEPSTIGSASSDKRASRSESRTRYCEADDARARLASFQRDAARRTSAISESGEHGFVRNATAPAAIAR